MNMSQQRTLLEKTLLLLCSTLVRPYLDVGSISGLLSARDMDILERAHQKLRRITEKMEHFPYEERLGELGLFSLEKRKFRGILTMCTTTRMWGAKKTKPDFPQW